MGYALFAQRKLVLNGQLNSAQLQQTQRSNEQYKLATQTLSLQQQMTSMTASQSFELSMKYDELAKVGQYYDETNKEWKNRYEKQGEEYKDLKTGESISSDDMQQQMDDERERINAEIKKIEAENQQELDDINRQIYLVGVKEKAIELEVKRLDTMVTALQKQLEAVQDAESKAIDNATPKFKGLG